MMWEQFFYLLFLVCTPSIAAAVVMVNPSDADAIADFTKLVSNPPASWVGGGNVCGGTFVGIACDSSGRITSINLTDNGLSGTLTPLISSLTSLEYLNLGGNRLTGTIPSLAGMSSLTQLILHDNGFTALPSDFLENLTSLVMVKLDNLPLEPWFIPEAISGSSLLQTFMASNASITGQFPEAMGNLKSLSTLWLPYNFLGGSLPVWISNLTAMKFLNLNSQKSEVKFSGSINVLASFRSLKELSLNSNAFSGQIPDFMTSHLEIFNIRDNLFTGLVPASLQGMETLQAVSLSNNFLQGQRPVFRTGVREDLVSGNRFCLHDTGPCDPQVSNLLEVAAGFGFPLSLAKTWGGNNACSGRWAGVKCKSLVIIAIELAGFNLTGEISPAFGSFPMLETMDVSNNNLTGVIPKSLTALSNLRFLNVSNNHLSGVVPKFAPWVHLVLQEGGPPNKSPKSKSQAILVIVGIIVAAVAVGVLIGLCIFCFKKKSGSRQHAPPTTEITAANNLPEFHINELLKATDHFNVGNIIGEGGFATVFKATLNGEPVAVKRFRETGMGTEELKEFLCEIDVLGKLRHRNLVRLLGYCRHDSERILVYEFMPGGTLREHLQQQQSGRAPLTWAQRLDIALDVARAIEYLHTLAHEAYIHRDLKPDNILLDNNFRAKVSDFGLVRKAADKSSTIHMAGTLGYVAPEYAETGKLTTKFDVYAYGIILMELISGRIAIDKSRQDDVYLVDMFRATVLDPMKFWNIVDRALELSSNSKDSNTLLEIATLSRNCTSFQPDHRPTMTYCVNLISNIVDGWNPVHDDEAETSKRLPEIVEEWKRGTFGSDIPDSA